jgi:hypothetical protein
MYNQWRYTNAIQIAEAFKNNQRGHLQGWVDHIKKTIRMLWN